MNGPLRIVSAIVALGLLGAAMWLDDRKSHLQDRMGKPLVSHGRIGAVVDNPVFSVKVGRVDVAGAISKDDPLGKPSPMPSLGVFVIVYAQIKSNQKPYDPNNVRLTTRGGLSYDESGRSSITTFNSGYEPMLWGDATWVFEIPKDRLAGIHLVIGDLELVSQLSAETDVDLGVDGAKATQLLAHLPGDYVLKNT